jgi:hypothetical protein
VPEAPFSSTENYGKFNAFVIGMKLEDTYDDSDLCINNVVAALDGNAYYKNNLTIHDINMTEGTKDSYFEVYLNAT